MVLVRGQSELVAKYRRARPCRVLLGGRDLHPPPVSVCDRGCVRWQRQGVGDDPRPNEAVFGQVLRP